MSASEILRRFGGKALSPRRFRFLIPLLALPLECSCESLKSSPAEGPRESATVSHSVTNRARTSARTSISISASPSQIAEGGTAVFTINASSVNASSATTVNYAMSGTASLNSHYSLGGTYRQVIIPAGSSSGSVTLNALATNLTSGSETATMILKAGTGYKLASTYKASVTILNTNATPTPSPTPSPNPTATPTPNPTATPSPSVSPTPSPSPNPSPTASPAIPTPTPTPTPSSGVWIAPRTDGQDGTGTLGDPYNGSTAARIITVINNKIPDNTVVHFAPGNYLVSSLTPKNGMKFLGAGKNLTNFFWDGSPQMAMILAYGGRTGIVVSDLTFNGQQDIRGSTPMAINAVDCNDFTVRNVRVTNFKGSATAEGFPLAIFCDTTSVTGALIEYCEVDHCYRGTPLTSSIGATLLSLGHGGAGDPTTRIAGTIQYNYIHDCPNVQALGGGGTNSIYQGNLVVGCQKGWYRDVYLANGTQVINNQFLNCTNFGIVASSNASGVDDPSSACDGLIVANNVITMDPSITVPVAGVLIIGQYVTNTQVWGNSVTKDTATSIQYGFNITSPGSIVHDNSASFGFTNIP